MANKSFGVNDLSVSGNVDGFGLTSMTAKSATGTEVDFTGIPSWVKRITVMFNGVSTNGTSAVQIQLGDSGGVETTGYNYNAFSLTSPSTINIASYSSGFVSPGVLVSDARVANCVISNITGDTWVANLNGFSSSASIGAGQGAKALSGTLDRIRITTVNGTDTFDQGTINIMYE